MEALRTRYIIENYDPVKKQMMGLPPTPAQPIDIDQLPKKRPSNYSLWNALTSSYTWIPIFSFFAFALAYSFCVRDGFLLWIQRNSFIIVLLTLVPLAAAVVTSSAGKALGNMTPWEPSKIPFLRRLRRNSDRALQRSGGNLLGHSARARHRAAARDGDDAVRSLLCAERLRPDADLQRRLHDALSRRRAALAAAAAVRRFSVAGDQHPGRRRSAARHSGESAAAADARAPDSGSASRRAFSNAFICGLMALIRRRRKFPGGRRTMTKRSNEDPQLKELAEQSPAMQKTVNVDIWFDKLAFQPAQAIFGIASGKTTGRGLGLGFPEVIPIADSDYVYAALRKRPDWPAAQ